MTIKQQGGIFGRNPSFNEVEVSDLTTTNLTVTDATVTDEILFQGDSTGKVEQNKSSGREVLELRSSSSGLAGGSGLNLYGDGDSSFPDHVRIWGSSEAVRIDDSNNTSIYGNLIIKTSGQGIDFSATSGTGTSELFDDYEEGTWTPAFIASGVTITHDIQVGRYVKVGDMVTVWINIGTDAVSGTAANLSITGLPYSSESGYSASGYVGLNYSFASPVGVVSIASSTTELRFYANNSSTRQTSAILGTGTNSNRLHIVCSYRVA